MNKTRVNFLVACLFSFGAMAQMKLPALSAHGKVEQTVGITTISVDYSRPSKRGRVVFPDVVPYRQLWRAGANKNTIITIDKPIEIQGQVVPAGAYSIFVTPDRDRWTVFFYSGTEHSGTPEKWDEKSVVLKTEARVEEIRPIETFTISINDVQLNSASLVFSWDRVSASVPFRVLDQKEIEEGIRATLAKKPTSSDYYRAADYYVNSKGDMKQAHEWITLAVKMANEKMPYWYLSRKAEIEVNLGDYKQAISTAELGLEKARSAKDEYYAKTFEAMIQQWRGK